MSIQVPDKTSVNGKFMCFFLKENVQSNISSQVEGKIVIPTLSSTYGLLNLSLCQAWRYWKVWRQSSSHS